MPTRIKRYEERADRLDELLARIEDEMGPEAQVERRDFVRGRVLGLFGGVKMIEVVATLEVDTAAILPAAVAQQPLPAPAAAAPELPPALAQAPPPAAAAQPAAPLPVFTTPPRIPATIPAQRVHVDVQADAPVADAPPWEEEPAAVGWASLPAVPAAPAAAVPAAAAEPASTPAPAPTLPSGDITGLKESIAELQQTMRELLEHQRQLLTAPALPPAAAASVLSELEAEIALEAAAEMSAGAPAPPPGQAIDPVAIDPASALLSAQRGAYDRLLDWNIGPYDALELLNSAMTAGEGDAPLTTAELLTRIGHDICRNVLLSGGIKLRKSPPGKVVALVGATGVGKTTTIAKLAANFAFQQGKRVSLVSLDNYRIAAAEQLRTYTEIMGINLDIVFSRDELDQVLTQRLQDDLVLIDTAGRSPLNLKQIDELREIFSAHPPDEVHLVLTAPTKADDLRAILENFLPLSYDYIIISKLDETRSLGCLHNVSKSAAQIAHRQVPISYFTVGQSVPEDIRTAELSFIQSWIEQGRIV